MDAKNVQEDLNALQILYGLLKSDRDDTSEQHSYTKQLGANARCMLKNLLDEETKRTVKAVLEIISGQVQASETLLSSADNNPIQQSQALLSEEKPIQPTLSMASESTQNCVEDLLDSGKGKLNEGFGMINSLKEKTLSRQGTIEGESKEKRCRLCRRNTIKKAESGDVALNLKASSTDLQMQKSNQSDGLGCGVRSNNGPFSSDKTVVTSIGDKVCVDSSYSEANKPEAEGLPEEVSKAIKQIGLCLSIIQLADENLLKNSAERLTVKQAGISQQEDDVHGIMTRNKFMSENTSRRSQEHADYSENHVPSVISDKRNPDTSSTSHLTRLDSIGELKYPSQILDTVQGCNVKSITDNTVMRPEQVKVSYDTPPSLAPTLHSRLTANKENGRSYLFNPDEPFPNNNNNNRRSNCQSVDSHRNDKKSLPLNTIPYHPQHKERFSKNTRYTSLKRASRGEKESNSSPSSSSYASNSDDSEDHSSYEEPRNEQYMTPTSSESLLSPDLQSQYSSYTGDGEEEIYSSEGNQEATASTSSSDGEEYSSYDRESTHNPVKPKYYLNQPTSKNKPGFSRIHRSAFGVNSKAKTGTWKRLIDRLAIIFHHHHHHHHHHGKHDVHRATKMGRSTSKRQDEAYAEKAIQTNNGRSRLHEKDQLGHFNGLMGGFLRHAWHTKRSKQKQTIGELGQGQRRGKKTTLKKSNWLKLVKHHRRAKLPSKSRAKLALGKKKITIKALPS